MNLLDRLGAPGEFRRQSVAQFLALRIAQKLDDVERLHNYVRLVEQLDRRMAVRAYRRTAARRVSGPPAAEIFEEEVSKIHHGHRNHG
jgi:hypothetical protein